ncbi:hypothetical protein ACT7CN_08910 [Bacillus cereus]
MFKLHYLKKETIFDEEKAKGTAAITVGVKRGQLLTADQVAGIQQMISAAVPGVKAEEVSVIDSKKRCHLKRGR